VHYVSLTSYGSRFDLPVAFRADAVPNVLAKVISNHGLRQLHVAETEKYAHVTFYFNGGEEIRYLGEDWVLVPSPRVESYDCRPEMSARKVAQTVIDGIRSRSYGFVLVNFANPDMVGHTGNQDATVRAVEFVDSCLGRIVEAAHRVHGICLVTADHGNADVMREPGSGEVHTAHSTNPVPFIVSGRPGGRVRKGILADVAPTVLDLLKIAVPREMTGKSLLGSGDRAAGQITERW
jgi:2,3-bisphosphoglycerate-independent phosphoglycerate mutase